ncbi:MAG: hypothetical protein HC915_03185 [Anaerolineae bacterium]|nr:hypothetical protein [Anaerolineae bacterium]
MECQVGVGGGGRLGNCLVGLGLYYVFLTFDRDRPVEVEVFPGAELIVEETLRDGWERQFYLGRVADPGQMSTYIQELETHYRDQGFTCVSQFGDVYENATRVPNAYIRSRCLLDRTHPLGFRQSAEVIIQPRRVPVTFLNNDPNQRITGGGELTGEVDIDVQRRWGTFRVFG